MQIPGYRIIRKIDQGGMSTVYLAIQLSVGREVALKVMSPVLNADPVFSERFQREANIVGQLSHHHIVSIYDIGRHKNLNYIAMDFLPGGSAHDKMSAGLSDSEALRITRETALALNHAHDKGYIHRDIKPENILFRTDGSAVLSDFGVAKTVSAASRMTNAGTVVGTPHYMSPEQARGKPVDGRSDIYSLGVVFFEMLTGSVPYQADEAIAIAIKHLTAPTPKLPPQYAVYQNILNKLLAKDPDERFQTGKDLVDAIDAIENTLTGSRTSHMSSTDASGVQVLPLFKALMLTSYAIILMQASKLGRYLTSWRWTPKRGIYRRPAANVIEIHNYASSSENNRSTVVSTRIQRAAHFQAVTPVKYRILSSCIILTTVATLAWAAFSVSLRELDIPGEQHLPPKLVSFAELTAQYVFDRASNDSTTNTQPIQSAQIRTSDQTALSLTPPLLSAARAITPSIVTSTSPSIIKEKPPLFPLTVNSNPENARIRILNITESYYPGIKLLPGRYHLEVSFKGYDTINEWIEIERQPLSPEITLRKTPVPGALFANALSSGGQGPEMVIVPEGSFSMGRNQVNDATPVHTVRISNPFAISKYEITFADYAKFTAATGRKLPNNSRWGKGSRPVINVSWEDANAYANWLKNSSGRKYRLPTEAEWEYIARANTNTDFWWGDASGAKKQANCRRGCDSDYSGLFSGQSAPVGSYAPNAFGVYDSAGNVAEWVQDCFVGHYLNAPKDGSSVERDGCNSRSVRGGSLKDSAAKLASYMRDSYPKDKGASHIGFRVVVELY